MSKRTGLTVWVCLAAALLPSCANGNESAPAQPPLSGEAKSAPTEGLPVPAVAKLVSEHSDEVGQTYVLRGVTSEELESWYARQLPLNKPWKDWRWCRSEPFGESTTLDRVWYRPGTNQMLSLTTGEDPPGTGFVIVYSDENGPCNNPEAEIAD